MASSIFGPRTTAPPQRTDYIITKNNVRYEGYYIPDPSIQQGNVRMAHGLSLKMTLVTHLFSSITWDRKQRSPGLT